MKPRRNYCVNCDDYGHDAIAHREIDVERTLQIIRSHLLCLMRDESEDRWAAGWVMDLEFILWAEGGTWHELARLAGGWWTWPDTFVPLDDWLQVYANYVFEQEATQ